MKTDRLAGQILVALDHFDAEFHALKIEVTMFKSDGLTTYHIRLSSGDVERIIVLEDYDEIDLEWTDGHGDDDCGCN